MHIFSDIRPNLKGNTSWEIKAYLLLFAKKHPLYAVVIPNLKPQHFLFKNLYL